MRFFSIVILVSLSSLLMAKDNYCGPTTSDQLGPYFVKDVPFESDLTSDITSDINEGQSVNEAEKISLEGKVLNAATLAPLSRAQVEIWHADQQGNYWPEGSGSSKDYPKGDLKFRGRTLSDARGIFSFKTILPGNYGSRPKHFHFKITLKGFQTLITQTYFKEDEALIKRDYSARRAEACRILSVVETGKKPPKKVDVVFLLGRE